MSTMNRTEFLDSHIGDEPRCLVVAGGPGLGRDLLSERVAIFQQPDEVVPTITGAARVMPEETLLPDSQDPVCLGIR